MNGIISKIIANRFMRYFILAAIVYIVILFIGLRLATHPSIYNFKVSLQVLSGKKAAELYPEQASIAKERDVYVKGIINLEEGQYAVLAMDIWSPQDKSLKIKKFDPGPIGRDGSGTKSFLIKIGYLEKGNIEDLTAKYKVRSIFVK